MSVAVVLALAVAAAVSTGAEQDGAPPPGAAASCPEPEAVRSALRKLATQDDPDGLVIATADAGLAIEDLGDRMRVRVGGRTRTYADATRDCERRARLAAVFAALVLTPGGADDAGEDEPAPAPPPPTPPAPAPVVVVAAPAAPRRGASEVLLEAAPAVAIAPHRGVALVSPAVIVGFGLAGGPWRLSLTAGAPLSPATYSIGTTAIGVSRYPLWIGGARVLELGRLRAAVELALMASVLRVERTGPPPVTAATRAEGGAHVGADLALPIGRVSVYLAVASDWITRTYPITLDPEGEVDRTPWLWFWGEAGLRFSLH